jgi:general secretion pathway protein G
LRERGFTLLELMVVIAIIVILLGMATVSYRRTVLNSREAVLRTDLRAMREAIENYTMDKLAAPQTLNDLLGTYLHGTELPTDPITQHKDWKTRSDDVVLSPDQTTTGITDVYSASEAISPNTNTPYSSW